MKLLKGKSELDTYCAKAAALQGRIVTEDPQPENGLYYRSDHFPFARAGVPGTTSFSLSLAHSLRYSINMQAPSLLWDLITCKKGGSG